MLFIILFLLLTPQYWFFDDKDVDRFVLTHFATELGNIWPQLTGPLKVMKFDLFRIMVVFMYGGFYLDMDMHITQPLTPLLEYSCVFPHEEYIPTHVCEKQTKFGRWPFAEINCPVEFPQIGNFAFGAGKKHVFLKGFINNFVANWIAGTYARKYSDVFIFTSSGPDAITHFYNHSLAPGALAERPDYYWAAKNCTIIYPSPYAKFHFGNFGTHVMAGTWRKGQ